MKTCKKCGQPKPESNFAPHKRTTKAGPKRVRSSTCRKCQRAQRKSAGLCVFCTRPAEPDKSQCSVCLEAGRRSRRERSAKRRQAALNHYGRACRYCGETTEIFLTIDHIDDNGATHRRQINNGKTNCGVQIYHWLYQNNFPEGFQVLCYNCNCAKGIYGAQAVLDALHQKKQLRCNEP